MLTIDKYHEILSNPDITPFQRRYFEGRLAMRQDAFIRMARDVTKRAIDKPFGVGITQEVLDRQSVYTNFPFAGAPRGERR